MPREKNDQQKKFADLIRRTLSVEQFDRSIIYRDKRSRRKGEPINTGIQAIEMPFDGVMVFVDLAPHLNWAHPCVYVFIENNTLMTKIVEASLPPDIEKSPESFVVMFRYGKTPVDEHDVDA